MRTLDRKNFEQSKHGEPGHVNVCIRDQDSDITGHGQHNRLLVFKDSQTGRIEMREDIKWGLPYSTELQRKKVLNGWQRMHPRGRKLKPAGREENDKSIWHYYELV